MKSEKARHRLYESFTLNSNIGIDRKAAFEAVELAEQEAEERMRDKFYYGMWNWIRRYWRNVAKVKDIAPQTAAAYERALAQAAERISELEMELNAERYPKQNTNKENAL